MPKFTFSFSAANNQYIQIEAQISVTGDETTVHFPAWRPGRYELGNFAKNVRNFKIVSDANQKVVFKKTTKDSWLAETKGLSNIRVQYMYYASELNAGSTYLDQTQLYVNPVNCCVFTEETFNDPVTVELNIPEAWQVATSLKVEETHWTAESMEELFDSPFICSAGLQHQSYESNGVLFHVWFNGIILPDWDRVLKDFKAFTDAQMEKFTEFPTNEYHFMNQIVPYKAYHGVEHLKSTVILLGPSYDVFKELYKELLGVSSHELYHAWNVKSIRPIEMYPYDFKRENYSRMGYLCEGVTTYMGDLFLLKSKVFDDQQYFDEFNMQLQRHFDNPARFVTSVGDSSFDTWLDGYVPGAPGRKVSIYTEGCLLAFITDVRIRMATKDRYGLDEVMKRLYFQFALEGKGVSESDYQETIEAVSNTSFTDFFENYVFGTQPYESPLTECLEYLGLELIHVPDSNYSASRLGFKALKSPRGFTVKAMYSGGPAELGGLMLEDELVALNGLELNEELEKVFEFFDDAPKRVAFFRKGQLMECTLPEVNRNFYMTYSVAKVKNPNGPQSKAFKAWKG